MTESEAFLLIKNILIAVTKKPLPSEFGPETDLINTGILDSLDGMVFTLELEQATGKSFPEGINLVDEGYYNVPKLITFLAKE